MSDVHHRHECEAMLYRALYEIVGVSSQRLTCNLHRFILDAFTRRGMHVCRATMDQLAEFKEIVCPYVGRACNSLYSRGLTRQPPRARRLADEVPLVASRLWGVNRSVGNIIVWITPLPTAEQQTAGTLPNVPNTPTLTLTHVATSLQRRSDAPPSPGRVSRGRMARRISTSAIMAPLSQQQQQQQLQPQPPSPRAGDGRHSQQRQSGEVPGVESSSCVGCVVAPPPCSLADLAHCAVCAPTTGLCFISCALAVASTSTKCQARLPPTMPSSSCSVQQAPAAKPVAKSSAPPHPPVVHSPSAQAAPRERCSYVPTL